MRLTRPATLAILGSLLAAACTAAPARDAAQPPDSPERAEPVAANFALPGTEWVLVSLGGTRPLPMPPLTLAFEDSTYGGYSGCNWFGGHYVAGRDTLRFVREISSTLRGCSGPISDQESRYVNTLRDVRRFTHAADTLRLRGGDGRTTHELVRRHLQAMDPAQLQGTRWRLVSIGNQAPPAGTRITLAFQGDSLRGHAGCRDFVGTYHATGHRFHVTSMSMLQFDCPDEQRLLREGEFTGALSESRDYQIQGTTLLLIPVSGQVVRFEREAP
ncbi:MAG TPA: META domain-containing protein [Longimicrobium sp.]|nr:META domain-containing protein [Longimicrobium sp.]